MVGKSVLMSQWHITHSSMPTWRELNMKADHKQFSPGPTYIQNSNISWLDFININIFTCVTLCCIR